MEALSLGILVIQSFGHMHRNGIFLSLGHLYVLCNVTSVTAPMI